MIRLLSYIFSFKTLKLSYHLPQATIFAVVIIVGGELAVRSFILNGKLDDRSLVGTVESYVLEIREQKPALWFIGNSTLFYGVDTDYISAELGNPSVSLIHGSSTIGGSAAMLEYYLEKCPEFNPSGCTLIICYTKDDLNSNGYRAEISREYIRHIGWQLRLLAKSSLYRCKGSLLDGIYSKYIQLRGTEILNPDAARGYQGEYNSEWLQKLANDYTIDEAGFRAFVTVAEKFGRCIMVNMPVTEDYIQFHDQNISPPTIKDVDDFVKQFCISNNIIQIDLSGAIPGNNMYSDPYHLNASYGRPCLSEKLCRGIEGIGR